MMPPAPTRMAEVPEATWQITTEVAALAITLHTSLIKSAVRDVLDR